MEKKRSMGLTMLGWMAIIIGILGLSGNLNPKYYFATMGAGRLTYLKYALSIFFSVFALICGIFILKLKPWARKLTIILSAVNIIFTVVQYNPKQGRAIHDKAYSLQEQIIREQYKPEYQEKALEKLAVSRQAAEKVLPFLLFSITAFIVGCNLMVIYFLTRQKIKEQFV